MVRLITDAQPCSAPATAPSHIQALVTPRSWQPSLICTLKALAGRSGSSPAYVSLQPLHV